MWTYAESPWRNECHTLTFPACVLLSTSECVYSERWLIEMNQLSWDRKQTFCWPLESCFSAGPTTPGMRARTAAWVWAATASLALQMTSSTVWMRWIQVRLDFIWSPDHNVICIWCFCRPDWVIIILLIMTQLLLTVSKIGQNFQMLMTVVPPCQWLLNKTLHNISGSSLTSQIMQHPFN